MARKVRIIKQSALKNGDTLEINGCIGFKISNQGDNDASYGYDGNPETFDIGATEEQLYGFLPEGLEFDGKLEVKFKNNLPGKIDAILFKAITEEK